MPKSTDPGKVPGKHECASHCGQNHVHYVRFSVPAMLNLWEILKCNMGPCGCCTVCVEYSSPPLCQASSLFFFKTLHTCFFSLRFFLFPSLPTVILVQMLPLSPSPSIPHPMCLLQPMTVDCGCSCLIVETRYW